MGKEAIECRGASHFTLRGWCPPVAGGFVSAAHPPRYVQEWLSRGPRERAFSPPPTPLPPGQVAWYLRSIPWILKTAGMRESHKKQTENKTLKMKQTVKLKCSVPDAVALDSCVEVNRDHPLGKTQDKTKQNKKPRKPQPVYSR